MGGLSKGLLQLTKARVRVTAGGFPGAVGEWGLGRQGKVAKFSKFSKGRKCIFLKAWAQSNYFLTRVSPSPKFKKVILSIFLDCNFHVEG